MGVYNVAIHTGEFQAATFKHALHSFPLEWFIGLLCAFFIASTPSGTDALTESDGFGVYIKLERDDTSSIALRGFLDYERLVCEKDSYI